MSVLALIPRAVVLVNGSELAPELAALLIQLRVRDTLRLPDQATLRLADPLMEHVDQDLFVVGQTLEVRYGAPEASASTSVFSGKIESSELELADAGAFIAATAYEPAYALHRNRRTDVFQQMNACDIAEQVIRAAGLTPSVEASSTSSEVYPFVLQNDETDWQLLWRLADRIDYEVVGDGSTIRFRPASPIGSAGAIALKAPDQLLSFRSRVSGAEQVQDVVVRGWDPTGVDAIVSSQSSPDADSTPGIERSQIAGASGTGTWAVSDRTVVSQSEADALATSVAARIGNAWLDAEGTTSGDPRLKAGCHVDISGVGQRFGGTYLVTSTTHVLDGGRGYRTHFTIAGRAVRTLLELVDTARTVPPWGSSLVVGVVTQTTDPDNLGRIRVRYPALGDSVEGWWARVASPAAGSSRGLLMMPVAGDEVVLAFEGGDPRRPYVLGSVWNGQAKPGELVAGDGSFVLASDHKVTVTAAEQANVTAKEGALGLTGKTVAAEASGGEFQIKGATVTIQADGSVSIKGAAITVEATADLTLKAATAIRLSGSQVMFS